MCCRSVSSSRSQSQAVNADSRSVRTMSTIIDDVDKPDEADETSSNRSMSSTTSTNYGAPKQRPSTTPLYTIPDEAAASEDGEDQESGSQSGTEVAEGLPASAAAQALQQEADELIPSSQHASSSANSLADESGEPLSDPLSASDNKHHAMRKSMGSAESLSGVSELSPVSADESSRRVTGSDNYDDEGRVSEGAVPSRSEPSAVQGLSPTLLTQQALSASDIASADVTPSESAANTAYPLTHGIMQSSASLDPDSLHTPRAMGPPATPGAPLVPKIDAGPAADPPQTIGEPNITATDTDVNAQQTMFAGLNLS